jgi:uncharacterized membrane protein
MMSMVAALTFSGLGWLWPVTAVVAVTMAVLLWSYTRQAMLPPGLRWTCFALKAMGIVALAWCLLDPLWVGQHAKPGANVFAIIADNSAGLQVRDRGDAGTRGEALRKLLDPAAGAWQSKLGDTFDLRRYYFDARLQATNDFHELDFGGRSTALASALRTLAERLRGRPAAGVLLLTDGNATDLPGGRAPEVAGLPPIFPVVIGRPEPIRDISVQQAHATESAFEDAPATLQADVAAGGYRGDPLVAQVIDTSGKVVAQQTADGREDGELVPFRFQLKPEHAGLSFYAVTVRERAELGPEHETRTTEATLANNRRVVTVDQGQGPFRVLYVSGRPNWEFKFLNRALEADRQLELVALIRVAKREPKFDFRGHAGETSNPLYRGFGNQAPEEVQPYDQPVIVRLNTRDENELRAGFPRTPEELYHYQAVIIDDVEAEFFAPDQAALLRSFVAERGGGLLMLGGLESFTEGKYARTPIGQMLPVYLDAADPGPEMPSGEVRLQLTREGWLQPWARLRETEADERARLNGMPPFAVFNPVHGVKPGASVVATVRDARGKEFPALAVQRFGRGRAAAMMVGDLWRWGMHDAASHADLDRSWRQLVRWMVSDVPARVECTAEPEEGSDAIRLRVRVRDEKFAPVDDATVVLNVGPVAFGPPGENTAATIKLEAEASGTEPGLYETTYVPRQTGGYRAVATVKSAAGADLGRAEAGWSSDLAAEEFRSLTPNTALLEDLARKTGGRVIRPDELPRLVDELPRRAAPVMETWTRPAWHTPAVFAFALICLLAEWGLRRWKGLP